VQSSPADRGHGQSAKTCFADLEKKPGVAQPPLVMVKNWILQSLSKFFIPNHGKI
jgi:hypothetical protein